MAKSDTLSWCQISGKMQEGIYSDQTPQQQQQQQQWHIQNFKRHFKRTANIQTSSETICYDHSILET